MTRRTAIGGPDDPRHGTTNGYVNLRCRCERCRDANTVSQREQRARRVNAPFSQKPHGTKAGYQNWGCRCDDCTRAAGYTPGYRAVVQRRREAVAKLVADGKTAAEISEELGIPRHQVHEAAKRLGVSLARPPLDPTETFKALAFYSDKPSLRVARNELIQVAYGEGFTLRAIGEQVGLTRQMVSNIATARPRARCEHCGQVLRRSAT
jgi:hypothetical protein